MPRFVAAFPLRVGASPGIFYKGEEGDGGDQDQDQEEDEEPKAARRIES